ncbi:hypothetical protein V8C43DRAFT_319541 [Trichoderma afarasin]
MFSFTRKSYFMAPKWSICPSSVPLGSVITSVTDKHQILQHNKDLSTHIDTEIYAQETMNCSGKIEITSRWFVGFHPFSDRHILLDRTNPYARYASSSSLKGTYACELMETRSFKPSPEFLAKVAADPAIKSRLESHENVFVVTGVKIANKGAITENMVNKMFTVRMGVQKWPRLILTAIDQPMLFAFQVEKVSFTWEGKLTSKAYDLGDEAEANCGMETRNGLDGDGGKHQSSPPV